MMVDRRPPSRDCWDGFRTNSLSFPSPTSTGIGRLAGLWGPWSTAVLQVTSLRAFLVYKQRGQTDEKDHNVKLRALCKPNVSSLPYSSDLIQSTLDTSGKKAVTTRVRSR